MTREEALRKAIELVDAETIPMKSSGYPADGWRAPTRPERLEQVKWYAQFLLGYEEDDDD